jgi:hypothetical protein
LVTVFVLVTISVTVDTAATEVAVVDPVATVVVAPVPAAVVVAAAPVVVVALALVVVVSDAQVSDLCSFHQAQALAHSVLNNSGSTIQSYLAYPLYSVL